ncbi:MAG: ribonuclease III [Terriglobales bacterium]
MPAADEPTAAEAALAARLGYNFRDPELLRRALTHRSWAQAQPGGAVADNELLEFLGDALLGLRVAERLLERFPASSEGELTQLRSWLVSARHLAEAAERLDLASCCRRAPPEPGARMSPRLLANAVEAVIAAIYADGGYAAAAGFVDRHVLGAEFDQIAPTLVHAFAHKSALQSWAHAHGVGLPSYRLVQAIGPDHAKRFVVEVALGGNTVARGEGSSRKQAEQSAAEAALRLLAESDAGPSRISG